MPDPQPDKPPSHNPPNISLPEIIIKPLKSIPNKRQTHLRTLLLLPAGPSTAARRTTTIPGLGGAQQCGVVGLVDLVGGEVGGVDVGGQARLEGRADPPQAFELDAAEEGVALELVPAAAAEAALCVADEAAEGVWVSCGAG